MSALNKPVRMCILCKERLYQNALYRYHYANGKLQEFTCNGRSVYICSACITSDRKILLRALNAKLKTKNKKIENFGEDFLKCVQGHNKETE